MNISKTLPAATLAVLLFAAAVQCNAATPQGASKPVTIAPRPTDTLTMAALDPIVSHAPSGEAPKQWIATPPAPMVIRKGENVKTASYHEARGYTFLINSMKRPRVVCTGSGRLVLVATAWLNETGVEEGFIITSDDLGKTWSQPRPVKHGTLVDLGGEKLMIMADITGEALYSEDSGETWSEPAKSLVLPSGHMPFFHGSVLVEGDTVYTVASAEGYDPPGFAGSFFRLSNDSGRTWDDPIHIPPFWDPSSCHFHGFSEGAITRARNGDLIVALRTGYAKGYANYNDHWRRIVITRSADNGKTWVDGQVYFNYGKVHSDLITLANGDLLLTYAVRIGELDGEKYQGIEAVLSHDNGKTWDWRNRFYLFRWNMMPAMHSPQTVLLPDGRLFTVYLYHYDASSGKRILPEAQNLGMVDGLYWKPW